MSSQSSVLLMGIKLAMDNQINRTYFQHSDFTSTFKVANYSFANFDKYTDKIMSEAKLLFKGKFNEEIKTDLEAYQTYCDSLDRSFYSAEYNNQAGKFIIWMIKVYNLDDEHFKSETLTAQGEIRLADEFATIWKYKGCKKWEEKVKNPASLSELKIAHAIGAALYKYVNNAVLESRIFKELKEAALKIDITKTSDDERRTIYDPITRSVVPVTDPALYSLIPPMWIQRSGDFSDVTYHQDTDTFYVTE